MDPSTRREHAQAIFKAGLAAADPGHCIHRALAVEAGVLRCGSRQLPLDSISNLCVIGAGKATAAMASAVEEILGDHITAGAISTKYGMPYPLSTSKPTSAATPFPTKRG